MKSARTYWFGPKRFGIGYGPRTWQGWVTVLIYGVLTISAFKAIAADNHVLRLGSMIVLTIAFLAVFLWKLDTSK
ncbi:hypothetical protein ACPPVV_09920 [Rhodanobacter sp. Col0626]|uniref:hypothetical protein n=1 Tax=Rhodanobacter sp. Col0626 TaxID=3415679 RepID=UPI003CEE9FE2